jgi:hypothetical protein
MRLEDVDLWLQAFLTPALQRSEMSASRPRRFTSEHRNPATIYVGGCVGRFGGGKNVLRLLESNAHRAFHYKVANPITLFRLYLFVQGGSNMTGTNCDLFTHK